MNFLSTYPTIAGTCVPSQRATQQSFPNPREFSETDWSFKPERAQSLDWQQGSIAGNNLNYFAKGEGYQQVKNGMFNQNRPNCPGNCGLQISIKCVFTAATTGV